MGLVEATTVPVGRTRRLVLAPSADARRTLKLDSSRSGASVAHEFWKHHYAEKLRRAGYTVELEAARHGGRVDILARTRGERVGVEIETGKSTVVQNTKNCLRSQFDRVVIVATSKQAREKIERDLARAGMLVRGRVKVVVAGADLSRICGWPARQRRPTSSRRADCLRGGANAT